VAGSCEYGDEPSGSSVTELVNNGGKPRTSSVMVPDFLN
jgi:hypothetical protein